MVLEPAGRDARRDRRGERGWADLVRRAAHDRHGAAELTQVVEGVVAWAHGVGLGLDLGATTQLDRAVLLELESENVTEVFTAFGEVGVSAENVAEKAVREMREYLKTCVPVGEHLADQLLLPLALAGSGSYRTLPLRLHARTQVELISEFLDVRISMEEEGDARTVKVG